MEEICKLIYAAAGKPMPRMPSALFKFSQIFLSHFEAYLSTYQAYQESLVI